MSLYSTRNLSSVLYSMLVGGTKIYWEVFYKKILLKPEIT